MTPIAEGGGWEGSIICVFMANCVRNRYVTHPYFILIGNVITTFNAKTRTFGTVKEK